ncbi:MAG: DNA-deoxyinosine glycosylase [Akkermansia sp.]
MKKCSFPPSVTPDCSVLVLGSLPGDESLRQAQYYAHPRNAFWKIMGSLLGFDPSLPYGERLSLLNRGGVGLWMWWPPASGPAAWTSTSPRNSPMTLRPAG